MDYRGLAERALSDEAPLREEATAVLNAPDEDLLPLLDAAFQVRRRYFGRKVQIHFLINAKSGLCPEDCAYCSQSSVSGADVARYRLVDPPARRSAASPPRCGGSNPPTA